MRRKNIGHSLNESFNSISIPKQYEWKKYERKIRELSEELEESLSKNQEYEKLVNILTEERNFYQQELKQVQHEYKLL